MADDALDVALFDMLADVIAAGKPAGVSLFSEHEINMHHDAFAEKFGVLPITDVCGPYLVMETTYRGANVKALFSKEQLAAAREANENDR